MRHSAPPVAVVRSRRVVLVVVMVVGLVRLVLMLPVMRTGSPAHPLHTAPVTRPPLTPPAAVKRNHLVDVGVDTLPNSLHRDAGSVCESFHIRST